MSQALTIEFDSDEALYNGISLANKLTGDYTITLQYNGGDQTGRVPAAALDTDNNLSITDLEINNFINSRQTSNGILIKSLYLDSRLFQDENSTLTDIVYRDTLANASVSWAPAIKKSMTIDFLSTTRGLHEMNAGSEIELISDLGKINPEPFTNQDRELVAVFRFNYASGFKIDDGDPGKKINVEIKNLTPGVLGVNFYNLERAAPANALNYAEHGALIDNNENLTLNNLTLDTFWAIGRNQRELRAAPILNKPNGELTIKGEVVSGQAFQYANSFIYNQGKLNFDGANVSFYDTSKVSDKQFINTFGGMTRAKGAIVNALGAELTASKSRFSQESSDRSGEYTPSRLGFTSQLDTNRGEKASIRTDGVFEAPSSLKYLINNYGTLKFEDSELSGVINTEGDASFIRSQLGLSKSNGLLGQNINLRGGALSLDQSIVDNIQVSALSGFSFKKNNSVVIKGKGSGDLSDAILSRLNPNQPSLFSDATRQGYALDPTRQYANINPLAYQTYDPTKLSSAVLRAVNSILNGKGASSTSKPTAGNNNGGTVASPDARNIVFKTTEPVTIKNTKAKDGQTKEIPEGRLIATKTHDHLIGDAFPDVFLFPNIRTGTNPKTRKHDLITNYHAYDQIEIDGFDVSVIGLNRSAKEIFDSYATIDNSKAKTIHKLFGNSLKPGKAAVFQVHGKPGSFLAVNTHGRGYNKQDMLVHITDFVPSTDNPLVLI